MSLGCVSIIPGALRPFEQDHKSGLWTKYLQDFLEKEGFAPVVCFDWKGGIINSYRASVHQAYAAHLTDIRRQTNQNIMVVAKSHGAVIVEAAVRQLEKKDKTLRLKIFLRIATGDSRCHLPLSSVDRVIDLASTDDRLYKLGMCLPSFLIQRKLQPNSPLIEIERHWVRGFSHRDFNRDQEATVDNSPRCSIFKIYSNFLQGTTN